MAQINKPSAPLVPPTTDADVENIVSDAIANDDTHASLVNGEVPSDQLPSYVDDVLEFDDAEEFPAEGETGKIYVALDTNYTYRWSGAAYVQVGGASLGEGNGIVIENDLINVDEEWLDDHLEESLATVALSGAYSDLVGAPNVANNIEVVEFQTTTPLTQEQVDKAIAGKLIVAIDSYQYTVRTINAVDVYFDFVRVNGNSIGSYVPGATQIYNKIIALNRSTRMLQSFSDDNIMGIRDSGDNFFSQGTAPTQNGNKIVREQNLYPIKQVVDSLATVATSGSYADLSNKPTILSAQDVQDMIDASINSVLNQGF